MLAYIVRRLLLLPVVLFGVTLIIFAMVQMVGPYKRLSLYVNDATLAHVRSSEELVRLVHKYGLDRPIYEQYAGWLNGVFHGQLGYSPTAHLMVQDALVKYLPTTAELALFSLIPLVFFAIRLGVFSAVRQNTIGDHLTRILAITGWSLPTFVAGLLLLLFFYKWFPAGRLSVWTIPIVNSPDWHTFTRMYTIDAVLNGNWRVFLDALRHMVLPIVTLSYISWALILRITRSSMLETLRQDYVTTARAKGLPERVVINRHARRNALIPVATVAGWTIAGLMGGVVITETIFNYPGLGRFAASAALQLDIAAVLGFALFNGLLLVTANLVVDVMYAFIDPRVRLE
ncbi:MAG: ABC transporter permease [Candidatus Bipolaricaulota bacterium]|jgi:peptide/nickel transport system permease protein|nr:ABC transporter permease [Candidatus Bipolaricaulota bacterium]